MSMGCLLSQLFGSIEEYEVYEPTSNVPRKITDWVRGIHRDAIVLNGLPPYQKFVQFVIRLLSSQSNEKAWWQKMIDLLYEYTDVGLIPEYKVLYPLVKGTGYRFPPRGTQIILDACDVYTSLPYPDDQFSIYLEMAISRAGDGFLDDPYLAIKGVGRKTRDLALTDFTLAYPVVDIHVKRVLLRLGLADQYDANIALDRVSPMEYNNLRNVCFNLSRALLLLPAELDRLLWHFGRAVCQKTPLCKDCPANILCPSSRMTMEDYDEQKGTSDR